MLYVIWIPRLITSRIQKAVKTRPSVGLMGARQTGKTTLLRKLYPDYDFVSLDLPSQAEAAERDPDNFLRTHGSNLIIDEVQYAPALFRHLKLEIDNPSRESNRRYLLTGSQKFALMKELSESLAGRIALFELEPLSAREIWEVFPDEEVLEILFRGGYPELNANREIDRAEYYRSYITTYLERDVRQVLNVTSLRDFERFMRALAIRSGQLLNKAELGRDVGVQGSTINDWLSVLEATNQIALVEPWFSNKTKSITKTPKVYLCDSGLLCALLEIPTIELLALSPHRGAVWETFVFSELRRLLSADINSSRIYHWRDQSSEIDFLIDYGGLLYVFEAKWHEAPKERDGASFQAFAKKLRGGEIVRRSIICRTKNRYMMKDGITVTSVKDLPNLLR